MIRYLTTILGSITIIMATPLSAQQSGTTPTPWPDYCKGMEDFSRSVMIERQNERSMSEMISKIYKTFSHETTRNLLKMIILDAYKQPAYSQEINQKAEINRFANRWATQCWETQTAE